MRFIRRSSVRSLGAKRPGYFRSAARERGRPRAAFVLSAASSGQGGHGDELSILGRPPTTTQRRNANHLFRAARPIDHLPPLSTLSPSPEPTKEVLWEQRYDRSWRASRDLTGHSRRPKMLCDPRAQAQSAALLCRTHLLKVPVTSQLRWGILKAPHRDAQSRLGTRATLKVHVGFRSLIRSPTMHGDWRVWSPLQPLRKQRRLAEAQVGQSRASPRTLLTPRLPSPSPSVTCCSRPLTSVISLA